MNIIFIFLISCMFAFLVYLCIDWIVHLGMTKGDAELYGWATYSKFKEHFNYYKWEPLSLYSGSYQSNNHSCYFHANIIKMDGKGMLITNPISYLFVKIYARKVNKKDRVIKW